MKTPKKHPHINYSDYFVISGFQAFKERLREELITSRGIDLDHFADDDSLYPYYQRGEPIFYTLDTLCGGETQ